MQVRDESGISSQKHDVELIRIRKSEYVERRLNLKRRPFSQLWIEALDV